MGKAFHSRINIHVSKMHHYATVFELLHCMPHVSKPPIQGRGCTDLHGNPYKETKAIPN